MPKVETEDKENASRDLFPLNPAMVRRLRAHDETRAKLHDVPASDDLKFEQTTD